MRDNIGSQGLEVKFHVDKENFGFSNPDLNSE